MIAIIDYGCGVTSALIKVIDELNCIYKITDRESDLMNVTKIILPGDGDVVHIIRRLHMTNLFTMLRVANKPVLGISSGMHILCEKSEEGCGSFLGLFPVSAKKFEESKTKMSQSGFNKIKILKSSKLFEGITKEENFYFDSSLYLPPNEFATSSSNYDIEISASMEKKNFYGVQFFPEKSGQAGTQLIKNFVEIC